MFAVVLLPLLNDLWIGGMLLFGAAAVSLRTLFDLHRKFMAGWSITSLDQWNALGQSIFLVFIAYVGGCIAFFLTCTGVMIATNAPFFHAPVGTNPLVTAVIACAYVAMVVTFGGLTWLMGPPKLETLRNAKPHPREEQANGSGAEEHDR